VSLRVFDATGRVIRTLQQSVLPPGGHAARWDGQTAHGTTVTPGIYFLELKAEGQRLTRRLVMLR